MRPLKRKRVRKYGSVRKFKRHAGRTKGLNMKGPMRGGIRL